MNDDLKQLLDAIRQENSSAHGETRRHFDVAVEDLASRFDSLAETVQHLAEKLDLNARGMREELRLGFAQTEAVIANLQTRIE